MKSDENDRLGTRLPADREPLDPAIEAAASEWFIRSTSGLDAEAQRELDGWRRTSPRHEQAYSRLGDTWAVFDRAQAMGALLPVQAGLDSRKRGRRKRLGLAVMTGALAAALGVVFQPRLPYWAPLRRPAVSQGAFDPIRRLPDGSIAELQRGTEISVEYEAAIRRIRLLKGEALFRVVHDAAKPFVVESNGIIARAVGTAFIVSQRPNAIEVVVTKGRVAVARVESNAFPASAREPVVVDQGQRVVMTRTPTDAEPPEALPVSNEEIAERLAWTMSTIDFHATNLREAVQLMNERNRLQIRLDDLSIEGLRLSGSFRSNNPQGFVKILEATFDLKSEKSGIDEVVLRRAK